jgi:RNA polymerase sigma-70 factor, ECF subfamily
MRVAGSSVWLDYSGGSRRCWNWQTGQTQTLLSVRTCGFKSHSPHQILIVTATGTTPASVASRPGPMLDSPGLRIAVRRDPPTVEDLRSTTVPDDPVQRRDLILLERARDGDLDAFNDLVVLYQDQLFALVVRMVPDRDQASDCVQEAFFSAYRNLTSFRGGSVKSWLNRICVNAAMDTQRARKRRPVQPYPELDDESWQPPAGVEADPERTALDSERTRALAGALAGITDDQRVAIVLYDVEGYDYAEIADMTGVSLGTVKSRIHRGRLALRSLLEDRMELFRG